MKLSNILSGLGNKSQEKLENFLALEINYETVKAAVWAVDGQKVRIVRHGSIEEWEGKDGLLKASDATITTALEGVTGEPSKMIFGLPFDWVEGDSIKALKKPLLANICEKLGLQPVGFVVSQEALITYLKNQQGTPLSAVLVQLMISEITVSLVSLGKIIQSENVGKSDDLALDIKEGLARIKNIDQLPARIILFDGLTDFEEAKQQIISYDWQSHLPFLHFPKVEALKRDFIMEAIAIAGGSEVAKSLGFAIEEKPKPVPVEEEIAVETETAIATEAVNDGAVEQNIENFGFVKEQDIAKTEIKIAPVIVPSSEPEKAKKNFLAGISGFFKKIPNPFKFIGNKLILILIILLVLAAGVIASWWVIPKAEIFIYYQPEKIEKNISFTLDENITQPDFKNKIIPAQIVEVEVKGEKQGQASGEKLVGDKAKGEVVIYNKTDLSKNFPKGTILVRNDNLKFVTLDSISIASSSSKTTEEGEEIIWGKNTVGIEAVEVGKESNTEKGVTFTLKDYPSSSFGAKNDNGLSGGTSKKVKTVTAQDKENLTKELTDELKTEAEKKLIEQSSAEKIVVENSSQAKNINETFDKKTGEETDVFNLQLTLALQSFSFKKEDLNEFLKKELSVSVPAGFTFNDNDFSTRIISSKDSDEKIQVEMAVTLNLLPQIDLQDLKKALKGKTNVSMEKYLSINENFVKAKVDIYPSIFSVLKRLPPSENRIEAKIELLQ